MEKIRRAEEERDHFRAVSKHHAEEMVLSYNVHMMHTINTCKVCLFYIQGNQRHLQATLY